MNNNKNDEAALLAGCKGVFSKSSYITIGTAERPEEFVKKHNPRSGYTGKQFVAIPPKDGHIPEVYFEKKWNWISDGDKYVDRIRYKDAQPDKKKGFLTSDFSKRDEFSNTVRTEQWREQLQTEGKFSRKAINMLSDAAGGSPEGATHGAPARGQKDPDTFLYDAVFEKPDPTFGGASHTHRDTRNKTMINHDRSYGDSMTTHNLTYQAPAEFSKPEHAHKPLIRDTFYRKTNVLYPAKCSADPDS